MKITRLSILALILPALLFACSENTETDSNMSSSETTVSEGISPEEFAEEFINVIESKDKNAYINLIHPASRKVLEKDTAMFDKRVEITLQLNPPSSFISHEVFITNIEDEKLYNEEKNALRVMSRWMIFPVKPEKIITIRVKEETGDESAEFPLSTQAIAKKDGKWYILWPTGVEKYVAP